MICHRIMVERTWSTGKAFISSIIGTRTTLTLANLANSIGNKVVGRARIVASIIEKSRIIVASCAIIRGYRTLRTRSSTKCTSSRGIVICMSGTTLIARISKYQERRSTRETYGRIRRVARKAGIQAYATETKIRHIRRKAKVSTSIIRCYQKETSNTGSTRSSRSWTCQARRLTFRAISTHYYCVTHARRYTLP